MDTAIRDDDSHTLPPIPSFSDHPKDALPSQSADMSASAPTTPPKDPKPKKSNPLNDLIDTERTYVEQLTGIIRKIAAAWSRSNLPPPELDTMFRCIEAVYKADKGLLSKLTEIGTNPSSPKALGDLLMKWIDDLDAPYTNYCNKYCCGFDDWEPVRSNRKLPDVLASFSASTPPTSSEQSIWTLDALFLLPKARLKYYRKLYNRLLKGTVAGRSDHRLLLGALEKLDALLGVLEYRQSVKVGLLKDDIPPTVPELEDDVVDMKTQRVSDPAQNPPDPNAKFIMQNIGLHTETESISKRTSEGNTVISNRESKAKPPIPIAELERRLSTEGTLDVFTMNPKAVRLQMLPPHLTFTREMRYSQDVLIRFTPKATNTEVVHRRGHVFLLSDLLLICEWMTPQEKAQREPDGPDLWLCYPPLAGKVLRTSDVEGQPHVLQIAVMKKEFLLVESDSVNTRNVLMQHLKECIEFSTSLPPPSKEPPPPVPPLRMQANSTYASPSSIGVQNGHINNVVPPVGDPSASRYPGRQDSLSPLSQTLPRHEVPVNAMTNLSLGPDAQLQRGAHRTASLRGPNPSPIHPQGFPRQPGDYQSRPSSSSSAASQNSRYSNPRAPPFPFNHPYPDRPAPAPSPMVQGGPYRPNGLPMRPPSDTPAPYGTVRKSSSMHSLASQYSQRERSAFYPPMPNPPADLVRNGMSRVGSVSNLQATYSRPLLPSAQMQSRTFSMAEQSFDEPSPPGSPVEPIRRDPGSMTSTGHTNTKCKVFLQQQHSQWKSLGSAKLNLYQEHTTNVKQLVVKSNKTVLISTIVLTDGVERVGKTGVAIELSDKGARTGIIYMLQLRDESSAIGLFNSLLAGSDRSG
ncbi:hypothetical protein M378DRAFT_155677 [Amanita muscaria Koide BX008]|uniref:DH domain-containing protein n=1 Tax=Amanita muscaria (strain Koide BX008) TaxID=946122 RepID=A0A0C2T4B6_AMAMK|nr:hypothetical protein M378DRAFT_155677 [Amanita muscaria Koide BX008]